MRTLLLLPVAALTLAAAPGGRGGGDPPAVIRPVADRRDDPADAAIDRGLRYLAGGQNADGSWPGGMGGGVVFGPRGQMNMGGGGGDIAVTSLAVMAFMSAGHVPGEGRYGPAVERGIRWVLEKQGRNGVLAPNAGQEMYHHGIATLMLAEATGMTSGELAPHLRAGLERAVAVILTSQRKQGGFRGGMSGGWRYRAVDDGDSDLSVTGWQLMALRAAKNVGCDIPAEYIQAAVGYVKRSQARDGGFQYQPGSQVTIPCTGVGVLCLELSGKEYHLSDEVRAGGAYLFKNPLTPNSMHFYYGVYYVSQAMFQMGGDIWAAYRPEFHKTLLQRNPPNGEGAWGARGGDAGIGGPAYATAMSVLALTVEYRFLPIYQRFEEPLERD
ncbi:MAG: prenyltransferase/squalene oxidase repeat-containing protein [Gemmataceae bacterium]